MSPDILKKMRDMGLTLDQAIELLEAMGTSAGPSPGAIRTRRYRERGGGKITEALRQEIFERDGYACLECGSSDYLQCDHVHPVSKGGETTADNLQTLCRVCNARKKDRFRKADVRGNSEDIPPELSAEMSEEPPLPLPSSPQTPQQPTPTPPDITTRARGDAGFARFWLAYPRKTAKGDARKAYDRAWRKLFAANINRDPEAVLIGGLERAKASWGDDAQYIPHPATWLNGERWDDEPETVTRKAPHERHHPDAKLTAKQDNYARAWAGSERAVGRDWEP